MNSCEPNLLYVLLSIVRLAQKVLPKERPAFIDGNRVTHDFQIRIVRCFGSWEVRNVIYPAYRANRIPDSDEVGFTSRLLLTSKKLFVANVNPTSSESGI